MNTGGQLYFIKKYKYPLLVMIKLIVAVSLITVLVSKVNISDIWTAFSEADLRLIAGAFLLYFIGLCVVATRWKLLLSVQGVNASFYTLLKSMIVAVFFNNFLPSTIGGDAMRAYDTWKMGSTKAQSVSIIFIDRFLGIFTLFMFALLVLLFSSIDVLETPGFKLWLVLAVLLGVGVIYILFFKAADISRFLQSKNQSNPSLINKILRKAFDVFAVYQGKPKLLVFALLLSILLQLNVILHYYLLALSIGIYIPLNAMFVIIPVAIVVMMIPVSINAIGVRELIFVALFSLFGVSTADALAFSWLSFILITLLGVIGGVVFLFRSRANDREKLQA